MTTVIPRSASLTRPQERRPYEPFGAARQVWRSAAPEALSAGAADTGKSRGWLEKLHYCASKYPHARICITRKTRKSLTQSAIVTYERRVLPEGLLSERARPGRIHFSTQDQQYEYPNGSIIAVSGLDDPEKLKSSEWDMIYFMEATEGSLNDWEMMKRGLRNGVMPYQQLGGDCNPSYPTHWLKQRCDRGLTRMFTALHSDNPSITPERLALLEAMTGIRYLRLFKGLWVAAEGVVYPEWNPLIHKVTREQLIAWQVFYGDGTLNRQVIKHIYGGADFGWTNPGCLLIFGMDSDGRLYLLREIYRTQRTIDWWIPQAQALDEEFHVEQWFPDPSRPDYIMQFNQAGLACGETVNAIPLGLGFMRERLNVAGDGRPRFFVYEYANIDPDELLEAEHKPTGFEREIEMYVWAEAKEGKPYKEEPVDDCNHACLVAGTLIKTAHGDIPIEHVQAGDYVLTRRGYKPVKAAGMTEKQATVLSLDLSDGSVLTGTANHPIYVQNRGYIDLHAARYGDIMETVQNYVERIVSCQSQKKLSTKVSHSGAIQSRNCGLIVPTLSPTCTLNSKAWVAFIKKSGKMLTGLFQQGITFITKMATPLITRWKTWNVSLRENIMPFMPSMLHLNSPINGAFTWNKYDPLPPPGTSQTRGVHGIVNMVALLGYMQSIGRSLVSIAKQNFPTHVSVHNRNFVPIGVNLPSVGSQALMISPQHVKDVEKNIGAISTLNEISALPCAEIITIVNIREHKELQPVYNLTVDATVGEYFANGFLVHNCDTARYVIASLDKDRDTSEADSDAASLIRGYRGY